MYRLVYCIIVAALAQPSSGFFPLLSTTTIAPRVATNEAVQPSIQQQFVATTVAVAGATGKTGRYVVQELVDRGANVVAVVRDKTKALNVLGPITEQLDYVECNLSDPEEIAKVFGNVDAAIWCATGFSDSESGVVAKAKLLLRIPSAPKQSIDVIGLPAIAKALAAKQGNRKDESGCPKLVMCSSSGVTRPAWSDEKKEKFPGAADIPIVRLNPFNILDRKRESEEELRKMGVNYCIVRPCGLNDEWPTSSRPIFSQGDVAVGRIHRKDVASILVDVLSIPQATGKTFEVVGLAGYPPPASIVPAIERLYPDTEGPPEDLLFATYSTMQQLLPGEKQDAAALAMGQTYEQLDKGETGRLGERGSENAESAAPKPSS